MNHPSRSQQHRSPVAEAERLREALAEVAYDVTPSVVPIAAIAREGRRRRRRRTAAVLGAACGVLLVPLAVVMLRGGVPDGQGEREQVTPPAASVSPSPSVSMPHAGNVRVVTPGERVTVSPGTKIWLTEDGKHWTEPDQPTQFRSVTDGNLDLSSPGVSLQESGREDGTVFLSGIFYGPGEPALVEIRTAAGDIDGTALTLAGEPGWGVWYAEVKVPESVRSSSDFLGGVTERVTVYDSAGGVIASQEFSS
ncbi:hypothetical protein ACFVYG_15605 [Streptomyces sp. NPDC058256]|uniref:hypothetical protein n=1 Tax=Streptomyces sp. NPDC058256 TaxID=3346408 RepID=UPI0036EA8067